MMVHERQVTIHCAVVLVAARAFDSITESGLPAHIVQGFLEGEKIIATASGYH